MSYLLDALRKSEAQRRLGEPPSIHAPAPPPRRRRLLPAALVAGTAALMLGGWLLLAQRDGAAPDARSAQGPAVASDAREDRGSVARSADEQPRRSDAAPRQDGAEASEEPGQPRTSETQSRPQRESPVAQTDPGAANRPGVQREIRIQPVPGRGGAAAREGQSRGGDGEPSVPAEPAARQSASAGSGSSQPRTLPEPPAPEAEGDQDVAGGSSGRAPAPPQTTQQPGRGAGESEAGRQAEDSAGGPIEYWELPVRVRTSLPEINLSIRVYDPDPDKRFVILGRERYGEGDSIAEGVILQEIRRDGVVLEYQDYRFRYGD